MRRRPTHTNGTKPASPRLGDTALAVACKRLAQKHGNDDNTEARKISSHLSMSMVWGARQWRAHSRRSRHVRNVVGWFRSTILLEIWPALLVAMGLSLIHI